MATISRTVYTDVDVDIDVDIEDYLDEVDDEARIKEAKRRDINPEKEITYIPKDLTGENLRRYLCDLIDSSYTLSPENLLTN